MKHLTTAFLLTIFVFITPASGDAPPTPKLPALDVPPQGMSDCEVNADIKIHFKLKAEKVLAEVIGKFDISCQKSDRAAKKSEIGFPFSSWGDRSTETLDFQADVDGKSADVKEKSWTGTPFGMYRGYVWSMADMPEAKRRITVQYSILLTTYDYAAILKPEYQKKRWCSFMFPLSGANFSRNIKSGFISIITDMPLTTEVRVPKTNLKIPKEHEIVWEISHSYSHDDDMQLHIEMPK